MRSASPASVEWSSIALLALTRRDHQIAVGIAKRRKAKKKGEEAAPAPIVAAVKKVEEPAVKKDGS